MAVRYRKLLRLPIHICCVFNIKKKNIPFKSEHFMYDLIQLMHDAASHAAKVGFFQLLRQRSASCRRLLAVLSGYHIR